MLSPNSSDPSQKDKSPTKAGVDKKLAVPAASDGATNEGFNPFNQRQAIRTRRIKRQQGSSRFINEQYKELEQLPPIKG